MTPIKCFMVEHTDHPAKRLWKRSDTGEVLGTQEQLPPGAMWWAPWYAEAEEYRGTDGRCLIVNTPAGAWIVDARASNCTRKDDKIHKCWCRHGEAPDFTVDKNGNTCSAGAGSILQTRAGGHKCDFHGFLRGGYLVDC